VETPQRPLGSFGVPGETTGFVGVKRPLRREAAGSNLREQRTGSLPHQPKEDPPTAASAYDATVSSHSAICRTQPARIWRDNAGEWRRSGQVTGLWEVICSDCGDDAGPYTEQTEHVQRIRGPYPNKDEAERALVAHTPSV
jgi:hypothetical protein